MELDPLFSEARPAKARCYRRQVASRWYQMVPVRCFSDCLKFFPQVAKRFVNEKHYCPKRWPEQKPIRVEGSRRNKHVSRVGKPTGPKP